MLKEGDEEAGRGNNGKTTSKSGLALNEWHIILRKAENREEWRKLVVTSAVVPQRSARLRDRSDEKSAIVSVIDSVRHVSLRGRERSVFIRQTLVRFRWLPWGDC